MRRARRECKRAPRAPPPSRHNERRTRHGPDAPAATLEQDARNTAGPFGGAAAAPPHEAYVRYCAKCHGAVGEGRPIYPPLVVVASQPNRTVEDLIKIMPGLRADNLEKRMPSFARKLSEEEKRAVAEWVAALGP